MADARSRPAPSPRRLRWALGAYLLVTAAYFVPGATWNPVSRFLLTRAVVEQGSLDITPWAAATGDRALVDDRYYSDKAPVPSLIAVPAYAVFYGVTRIRGRLPAFEAEGTALRPARRVRVSPAFRSGLYVCTVFTAGLAAALLGVALFDVLRRRVAEQAAVLGAAGTVLGTPLFPYATSFFGHIIAAAFLFGAFAITDAVSGRDPPPRRYAAAGACLVLAVGSEYVVAVPAAIVGAYIVLVRPPSERWRAVAWLAAGAALPAVVIGAYHTACFGLPWRTGYSFIVHPAFAPGHERGVLGITYPRLDALWGITFGRARGLFWVSPLCLLAIAAGVAATSEERTAERTRTVALAAAVLLSLVLVNASYYQWDGGWATGPRHVVPALGFVGLGAGFAFARPRWQTAAAALAGYSIVVMVLTTAVGLEAPPTGDAVFDYLVDNARAGIYARTTGSSNLGLGLGLPRALSPYPVLVWIVLGGLGLVRLVPPTRPSAEPDATE